LEKLLTDEIQYEVRVPRAPPDNWALFVLWLGYLAVSPSYKLAHLYRTEGLTSKRVEGLPSDFEQVLDFYDDFGDVRDVEFEDWWADRGLALCGDIGETPRATEVASLKHGIINHSIATAGIEQFLENRWVAQGMQNSVLVSIPVGLSKAKILKQISGILDRQPDEAKEISRYEPKYRLAGKRNNGDTLLRYLNTLIVKSALPDCALWRVGAASKISDTYSPEFEADQPIQQGEATHDRMILTILTSRALLRARMIAENAARGIFPSHKKCEHALKINLPEMKRMFFPDDT
jgi:hypothetical protein